MTEQKPIIYGSFGSAGAGNRGLRQTATGAGVGQTALVMQLGRKVHQARMDEPSVEEIWKSIKTQQCCYCVDERTFKAISSHWTRGHGIDLQDIRDKLEVPKNYSFISEGTKEKHVARGRKYYSARNLTPRLGQKRELSKFGIESQRKRVMALTPEDRKEHARLAQAANAKKQKARLEKFDKANPCIICGAVFERRHVGKSHVTVCSKACNEIRRKQNAPTEFVMNRIMKPCVNCGKEMWGHNITCSAECEKQNRSAKARNRTGEHKTKLVASRKKTMALKPVRLCEIDGCSSRHCAKGLCSRHYQASRVSGARE